MIGLGIWEIPVHTFIYQGTAEVTVKDRGGEYDFSFYAPGLAIPEPEISNVSVTGDTLSADATCDLLKGKHIHVDVTFHGDTCSGTVKGPMGIKIKISGRRVG